MRRCPPGLPAFWAMERGCGLHNEGSHRKEGILHARSCCADICNGGGGNLLRPNIPAEQHSHEGVHHLLRTLKPLLPYARVPEALLTYFGMGMR